MGQNLLFGPTLVVVSVGEMRWYLSMIHYIDHLSECLLSLMGPRCLPPVLTSSDGDLRCQELSSAPADCWADKIVSSQEIFLDLFYCPAVNHLRSLCSLLGTYIYLKNVFCPFLNNPTDVGCPNVFNSEIVRNGFFDWIIPPTKTRLGSSHVLLE